MAFDTFDTDSVATAGVTFTNGNLTAQGISGSTLSTSGIAQAREGKTAGKWHVEFTIVAVSGNIDGVGVLDARGLGLGFIGQGNIEAPSGVGCGLGYFTNSHLVYSGAAQTAVNAATFGAGDVIGVDVDLDNKKIWWTKNASGVYVGASGTPNPATNTGGFDLTAWQSQGRIYPAVNLSGSAAKITANFGSSAFTASVPSGFNAGWTNTTLGSYFGTFATTGNAGEGIQTPPQNDKSVSPYTATLTGSIASVVIPFAGTVTSDLKLVIYDALGAGGLPGNLLFVGADQATGNGGEISFPVSGVSVVLGVTYWFGVVSDVGSGGTLGVNVTLAVPLTNGVVFNSGTYASPTNPFGATPSTTNWRYPIIINVQTATPATGSASGSGAASGVGLSLGITTGSASGSATASAVANITHSAIGIATGFATVLGQGNALIPSRGSASGAGIALAIAQTVAESTGHAQGASSAIAGGIAIPPGPLRKQPQWSIMIYGTLIEGAAYDPVTRELFVLYPNGQYLTLKHMPFSVTNAIVASPNPQAYILALIAANHTTLPPLAFVATGMASGMATVTGRTGSTLTSVGSASGVGTALGLSPIISIGSASGSGTASATIGGSQGSATGSSTVQATGLAMTTSVGSASGAGTATGQSGSATGQATGLATVTGISATTAASVGSATGSATVSGVSRSLITSTGSATGSAAVAGSSVTIPLVTPNAAWTGVGGTGFAGGVAAPTDPTRTTAKPVLALLTVPYQAFSSNLRLYIFADAAGLAFGPQGISQVQVNVEGTLVNAAYQATANRTDENGNIKAIWNIYAVDLNWGATRAIYAGGGTLQVYVGAIPNDTTMQTRWVGAGLNSGGSINPYKFYPRASGVGAGCVNDVAYTVGASGKNFTTIQAALAAVISGGFTMPLLTLTDNASYPINPQGTAFLGNSDPTWATLVGTGLATIGDPTGATQQTNPRYDGLHFQGSGIRLDLAQMSFLYAGFQQYPAGSNGCMFLDGCEVTTGPAVNAGQNGSGNTASYLGLPPQDPWIPGFKTSPPLSESDCAYVYIQDCNIHDCFNGIFGARLALQNTLTNVCVQGHKVPFCVYGETMNGFSVQTIQAGTEAMTLKYTGPQAYAAYAKTSNNGATGSFQLWEGPNQGSATVTGSFTVNAINGGVLVSALVASINTSGLDWTATLVNDKWASGYLSLWPASGTTQSNIPRTQVTTNIATGINTVPGTHGDVWFLEDQTNWHVVQNRVFVFNEVLGIQVNIAIDINQAATPVYQDITVGWNILQSTSSAPFSSSPSESYGPNSNVVWRANTMAGPGQASITWGYDTFAPAVFTGAMISGTTLTGTLASGTPTIGQYLSGVGVTFMTKLTSGGSTGPWTVDTPQTVSSATTMVASAQGATYDAYCLSHHNSWYEAAFGGPTKPAPNIQVRSNSYQTGTTMLSPEANSKTQSGASDATLYTNPSLNNYTAKTGGPLLLTDGTWAGAQLPDGTWNLAE